MGQVLGVEWLDNNHLEHILVNLFIRGSQVSSKSADGHDKLPGQRPPQVPSIQGKTLKMELAFA